MLIHFVNSQIVCCGCEGFICFNGSRGLKSHGVLFIHKLCSSDIPTAEGRLSVRASRRVNCCAGRLTGDPAAEGKLNLLFPEILKASRRIFVQSTNPSIYE